MTDITDTTGQSSSASSASAGQQHGGEASALDLIFAEQNPEIPITNIDLTGLGNCTIKIGANGEIYSIVKDGEPPVGVPPVNSSMGN